MTYEEFEKKYPEKNFGVVNVKRYCTHKKDSDEISDIGWLFYLEHSCDEWEIGDIEDAEKMIINLKDAILYIKSFY